MAKRDLVAGVLFVANPRRGWSAKLLSLYARAWKQLGFGILEDTAEVAYRDGFVEGYKAGMVVGLRAGTQYAVPLAGQREVTH